MLSRVGKSKHGAEYVTAKGSNRRKLHRPVLAGVCLVQWHRRVPTWLYASGFCVLVTVSELQDLTPVLLPNGFMWRSA